MSKRTNASSNTTRRIFAILIGILASIVTLVTPLGAWVKYELTDTDQFVQAAAPLAKDPVVQQDLVATVTESLPPSLKILGGDALETIVATQMSKFMETAGFETAWAEVLRETHAQAIEVLEGREVGENEMLGLPLGPLVEAIKTEMIDSGVSIASLIPKVEAQIDIAPMSTLEQGQTAYSQAVGLGTWGPLVALGLWLVTIIIAPKRWSALGWLGIVSVMSALANFALLGLGQSTVENSLTESKLPADVIVAVYEAVAGPARTGLIVLGVAGMIFAGGGLVLAHVRKR